MSSQPEKILDAWLPPEGAGDPVACIATTFAFQPSFFEEECLARFLQLDAAPDLTPGTVDAAQYIIEREEKLTEARATVLVDRGQASPSACFRWDVIPTSAPPGGVQHSKVSLLIWQTHARLIVASANLTETGYRQNIEVFVTFDWPSAQRVAHVFRGAATFLEQLLDRHTEGAEGPDSPRGRAREAIRALRDRVPNAAISPPGRGEPSVELVHSLRGGSLLDQAFNDCWRGSRPKEAVVVSPYFLSRGAEAPYPVGLDAVRSRLATRGEVDCEVAATQVVLAGGQTRIDVPKAIQDSTGRGKLVISVWDRPGRESERTLHAKAIAYWSNNWIMTVCGSANCTGAGLGLEGAPRNIELCVAFGDRDARELEAWLPELLPLPKGQLTWADADIEEAIDSSFADRLPEKFREALYHPAANELVVEIDPEVEPHWWNISNGSEEWFSSEAHDSRRSLIRSLGAAAPPLELAVRWRDHKGKDRRATMVVSAAELDALPPPPELSSLNLEDILELLASGSRYGTALHRLLTKRARGHDGGNGKEPKVDPHARVDTSEFVLQRMRRAGKALEVLRERLERPVSNRDAVTARLTHGRLSPRALIDTADAAVEDKAMTSRERAFLFAELILTLRRVNWMPVGSQVKKTWCEGQAQVLIDEIGSLAPTGDQGIDGYLKKAKAFA